MKTGLATVHTHKQKIEFALLQMHSDKVNNLMVKPIEKKMAQDYKPAGQLKTMFEAIFLITTQLEWHYLLC